MSTQEDLQSVRRALQEGRLSVLDTTTGYHRSMYATCPGDGSRAPVYRTTRLGGVIAEVVFRCPVCGKRFVAQPEQIHLA